MSSTFVAIAASIAAVSISIVIGIKIYRRYRNCRKQQPPPPLPMAYPSFTPFPPPIQPHPFHMAPPPYPTAPYPYPGSPYKSPDRCLHCGSNPSLRPPEPFSQHIPERRQRSQELSELNLNYCDSVCFYCKKQRVVWNRAIYDFYFSQPCIVGKSPRCDYLGNYEMLGNSSI